ncbi:hypothetical protein BMS3Bbin12_02221 [bacterium BMS3Bbin12]|nr:hypothetical protein BMS3Abin12_00748 [bacterium BMS3Abin12]GBE49028.1 hypothetical protein BMS3Bbin12_02221 [bacterium BMS3Bbin12]
MHQRIFTRQSFGFLGSFFVSACCLGAAPVIAATAATVGLGAVRHVFNIYVLGPLMTLSVGWIVWNLRIQGRALAGRAHRYPPFWIGLAGGITAWVGVVLPHVVHGTKSLGSSMIYIGMAVLVVGSIKGLFDQYRRHRDIAEPLREKGVR